MTRDIEIDYETERFIEGEPFDYEEAAKVHAEFCRIREEQQRYRIGGDMPSKSKKHRSKMALLHKQEKITDEQWEDFKKIKKGKCKK